MLNLMVDWHTLNENIQLDQVNQNHIPTENEIKLIQTLNETKDLL